ncbi:hypothetical protein [Nocardiopsis sp. CA-288880]|uniref:hypothetical protein n=1 Tax=Nocardiopsis sp. CA-288880 TaxID=3239995 RepID=UPI003D9940C0
MDKTERDWAATYTALAVLGGALWFGEGLTVGKGPDTSGKATTISGTTAAAEAAATARSFRSRCGYTGLVPLMVAFELISAFERSRHGGTVDA